MTSYRPAPRPASGAAVGLYPGDVVAAGAAAAHPQARRYVRRIRSLRRHRARRGQHRGIYHQDTRYLSGLQLLINGRRPLLLSSIVQDNNALLTADLTNPDFFDAAGRLRLSKDTIHIVRAKFIWQARVYERLAVRNFDTQPHSIRLTVQFQTDFADLFEVRGHQRAARGRVGGDPCAACDRVHLRGARG